MAAIRARDLLYVTSYGRPSEFLAGLPHQSLLAMIALALNLLVSALINRWNGRPLWPCLLFPLGVVLNAFIMVRSAIRGPGMPDDI